MTDAHTDAVPEEMARLVELMATLRAACPWDRVQTHGSLRRHLLEESYEVLDALDALDAALSTAEHPDGQLEERYAHLAEELGDLLFQVVFHAHLAQEAGAFELADVARGVHDKLVARHPQIFSDQPGSNDVLGWEQAKVAEKGRSSVMDGIPVTLPALTLATKVVSKADSVDEHIVPGVLRDPDGSAQDQLGRALLALVVRARSEGLDAEAALRRAAGLLGDQVREVEAARPEGDVKR